MATPLKGSAVGTATDTAQPLSPEQRAIQQQAKAQTIFQPLLDEVGALKPPEPTAVPPAPSFDASTFLGLLASNLGSQITGRPSLAQSALVQRLQERQQVIRDNAQAQQDFQLKRQEQYLKIRIGMADTVLNNLFQGEITDEKIQAAQSALDSKFEAQARLDASRQDARDARLEATLQAQNERMMFTQGQINARLDKTEAGKNARSANGPSGRNGVLGILTPAQYFTRKTSLANAFYEPEMKSADMLELAAAPQTTDSGYQDAVARMNMVNPNWRTAEYGPALAQRIADYWNSKESKKPASAQKPVMAVKQP